MMIENGQRWIHVKEELGVRQSKWKAEHGDGVPYFGDPYLSFVKTVE